MQAIRILIVLAGIFVFSIAPPAAAQQGGGDGLLTDADLEELMAPIALYPDRLLANVLTAACYPDELAEAARVRGDKRAIEAADWEPSVKAVAEIPDALDMLTQYPDWTAAIGEAFILQSQATMEAVQRLRARAYDNGALQTTDQQVVATQGDTIIIEPAEPQVIYVPTYDPQVVYVDDSSDELLAGVIGFGIGVAAGAIIANNVDCDWYVGGCCWGCGWGHWGHGDVDIDIDRNVNIQGGDRNTIIAGDRHRGEAWRPNDTKLDRNVRNGRPNQLSSYRGVGSGRSSTARVPGRTAGSAPIASRPAPRPSQSRAGAGRSATQRPSGVPASRPSTAQRSGTPRAKPSIPPSRPVSPSASPGRSHSSGSRPSAYHSRSSHQRATSRGASSRGRGTAGGRSRGGGRRR